jgi:hypothetical protein
MPDRITIRRVKGWRMPPNTRVVTRATVFGNPWTVPQAREAGFEGSDEELQALCVRRFREAMRLGLPAVATILARLPELRGKHLACFCKPGTPCHADVLLEMANKEDTP